MADLDKKIQKAQTDLVQAVLEAHEKRNSDRVDMLVTTAIKQLKMSRFKPDLTTCLGLTYLARIAPKLFLQSAAIKENLKALLRRDSGPANLGGAATKAKSDIVLPVLAANLLLATCDSPEVRAIILAKIEQWLGATNTATTASAPASSNAGAAHQQPAPKISDLLQHLLATICMKCPAEPQTIASLLELRPYWLQYLEDQFHLFGPVPAHLSAEIRKLLHAETRAHTIVQYLKFLNKHDRDTFALSQELSEFILRRPMTLDSMLGEPEFGSVLGKMMLAIFIKLMRNLKQEKAPQQPPTPKPAHEKQQQQQLATKSEQPEAVKSETIKSMGADAAEAPKQQDTKQPEPGGATQVESHKFVRSLYVRFANDSKTITLSRVTIEAILTLLALVEAHEGCREEFAHLLESWTDGGSSKADTKEPTGIKLASVYEDFGLKTQYDLPDRIRQKLALSANHLLIEMGLQGANTSQLIGLLQTFSIPLATIEKILERLECARDVEQIKSEIKDASYFYQLIQFYSCMGSSGANELQKRLELTSLS